MGVVLALAACGRLGFQDRDSPDSTLTGETVTLIVTSDEYLGEPAGLPVTDATVLVDRGGALERMTTDANGMAQFVVDGVVAYHVVYLSSLGWRVYTAEGPRAGTFELGGRPGPNLNRNMTVVLPDGGPGTYHLRIPEQCSIPSPSSSPTVAFSFHPACDGRRVRMVAFRTNAGVSEYFDAGDIALIHTGSRTLSGSFQAAPTIAVEVSNLPAGTLEVAASVVARAGVDLTPMSPTTIAASAITGSATVMNIAARGGNALRIDAFRDMPPGYASTVSHVAPATIVATTTLDAAALPPPFEVLGVERLPELFWTGSGTGGSWIAIEAISGSLQWDAYVEPSSTSVTFPAIPPDLGVPTPTTFDLVLVTKLDIPGVAFDTLARTFDRTWREWPNQADLLPAGGSSMAQIRYIRPVTVTAP